MPLVLLTEYGMQNLAPRHLLKVIANSAADALLYDLLIALTVSSVNVAMPTVVDM
jgi:hypothetical protein